MKITIEVDEGLKESQLVLRCAGLTEDIMAIQKKLMDLVNQRQQLLVNRGEVDYYLVLDEILLFETTGGQLAVHTANEIYYSKYKLYELEELLPGSFMRVSKSSIINTNQVRAIHKNITGASEVEFVNSNKKTFVSRSYYKALELKLRGKRLAR